MEYYSAFNLWSLEAFSGGKMKYQVGDIIRAKKKLFYSGGEADKGDYFIIISEQRDKKRYGDYVLLRQRDCITTSWLENDIELCFEKDQL